MPTGEAAAQAGKRGGDSDGRGYVDKGPGSLAGNMTRDPELRYTEGGRAVCSLGVACSERVKDKTTGEWKDGETLFFEVVAWGHMAENVCNSLSKGDRIVCEGRWTEQSWRDKDDQVQTRVVMTARDLGPSMMFRDAKPEPRQQKGD